MQVYKEQQLFMHYDFQKKLVSSSISFRSDVYKLNES